MSEDSIKEVVVVRLEASISEVRRDASDAKQKANSALGIATSNSDTFRSEISKIREGYQALVVVDTEVDARIAANTKSIAALEKKDEQRVDRERTETQERAKQRSTTTRWAIGLGATLLSLALGMIGLWLKMRG